MEYVLLLPEQIVAGPEIVAGVAGVEFTVTVNVCADEVPQEFVAVTVMFPLVAFAVVVIEFVVELPLQPEGVVQV
jgi:hypothetical protein